MDRASSRHRLLLLACAVAAILAALWLWFARADKPEAPAATVARSAAAESSAAMAPKPSSPASPKPASIPSTKGSDRVSGRVLDPEGEPVANAQVGASAGDSPPQFTSSASDGSFVLRGLKSPTVNVFATAPNLTTEHVRGVSLGSDDVVIVLQAPALLRGRIAYAVRPKALFVRLCHFDPDFDREVCIKSRYYSPPEDSFELERLPLGNYDLVFSSNDRELARQPVTLRSSDTLDVGTVSLPR